MAPILFLIPLLLWMVNPISFSEPVVPFEECDVAEFYRGIEPDSDTKVLTTSGNLEEVEIILVSTRIDEGNYAVELTRKGSNLYKIEGSDLYIETRYCYEYATYDEAILKVESNFGYDKGTVFFD